MRLIDADALKAWFFRPYSNEEAYSNIEVRTVIDSQPTIDAVPVVRCKDCLFYDEMDNLCEHIGDIITPDWFCADGEREEEYERTD